MSIAQIPCRAEVCVGGLCVRTPYVLSFSVRKVRGQVGTCDASLKVRETVGGGGSFMTVKAGEGGANKQIFAGIVTQAKIEACHDDPGYMILSVSAKDVLMLLEGKKFTRRCLSSYEGPFCVITSVARKGLRSGKWAYELGQVTTDGGTPSKLAGVSSIPLPQPKAGTLSTGGKPPDVPLSVTIGG